MFKTAYDTLAGKKSLEPDTIEKLSSYLVLSANSEDTQLVKTKRSDSANGVYRLIPGGADIPAFSQPIYIENTNDTRAIVVDIRPFVTVTNMKNKEYKVNNHYSYDSILERLVLQTMWLEFGTQKILGLGLFPMRVFSRWVTNVLAKKLAVSQDVQYALSILSCYYYYCLHDDSGDMEFTPVTMSRIVGLIHRATGYEMRNIHDLVSKLPIVRDIDGFIRIVKEGTNSSRLDTLNSAGLFLLLGPTVNGHDPRVTAAVALEHPPTFVGLVHGALTFRGAGKTGLGEVIKPISNIQDAKDFTGAYRGLVSEFSK